MAAPGSLLPLLQPHISYTYHEQDTDVLKFLEPQLSSLCVLTCIFCRNFKLLILFIIVGGYNDDE